MATDTLLLSQAQAFLRFDNGKGCPSDALIEAWGDFFLIESARLRRFADAFRVPPDWKEDVIQGAWVEIVKKLRHTDFNSVEHFHCWMRKVIRIKVAYVFRRLGRHSTKSLDAMDAEPEDSRGKESARREKAKQLHDLFLNWLEKLQKKDRISYQLMKGRYAEERAVGELAAETKLTASQIYSRIHRLRGKFRAWALRRRGADMEM